MLMKAKDLDPNKYYHCIAQCNSKSTWLSKGREAHVFLGGISNKKSYFSRSDSLDSTIDWEVREATQEEKTWIIQCIYEGKLVPRPMEGIPLPVGNYEIF